VPQNRNQDEQGRLFAGPALVGDRLVLSAQVGGVPGLAALDAGGGGLLWQQPLAAVTSLCAYQDTAIAGTAQGFVVCLDAGTGQERWRRNLGAGQTGGVWCAVEGDTVAAYWEQGLLCVLDAATGAVRWQADVLCGPVPPVICAWRVVVRDAGLQVRDWRLADGAPAWSWDWRSTEKDPQQGEPEGPVEPHVPLVAAGGRVVTRGPSGSDWLVGLDPARGTVLWRRPTGSYGAVLPVAGGAGDVFFLAGGGADLSAYSATDGRALWAAAGSGGDSLPGREGGTGPRPPVVALPDYWVEDAGSLTRLLDRPTGAVVEEVPRYEGGDCGVAAREQDGAVWLYLVGRESVSAWRLTRPAP
jgi:outer membrane protein assembly factor BamB